MSLRQQSVISRVPRRWPSPSTAGVRGGLCQRVRVVCVAASITVMALVPVRAGAQWTVYDPANYAENVLQYVHQLMQIRYQVQQMTYQLQALRKLPGAPWRDVRDPLRGIDALMSGGPQTLGYGSPGVGAAFRGYFPVSRPVADWPTEERAQSQAAVDVFGASVLATSQQQASVAPGMATLERMKQLNAAVQGHEQALELQNTAAVYTAEELMLLRQAAMAQTNIEAVYYAHQVNAEAQRDASVRAALGQLATPPAAGADVSLRVGP